MSSVREKLPPCVRKRGKNYSYQWWENGKRREKTLGSDLSHARKVARKLAGQLVEIKAGTADPREARWAESELTPLVNHVQDWHRYLIGRGVTQEHADTSALRVRRLIDLAKTQRISGLSLSVAQDALRELRQQPARGKHRPSQRTVYASTQAIKRFARWLWSDGRTRENNLVHLKLPEVVEFRTRKALDPAQISALIECTRSQPERAGISGVDRSVLYAVGAGTGFRLNELLSLTVESFDLGEQPTITCKATNTKNGRAAIQPVRPELAEMLRPWLAEKAPGQPVFVLRRFQIPRVIRRDLQAAGIENAPDFDFHSLRHSFITAVVKSGCSVKVAQTLARHANPALTMNVYTHLGIHDLTQGLEGLASTLPPLSVPLGHTGTDDNPVISSPGVPQCAPEGHTLRTIRPKRAISLAMARIIAQSSMGGISQGGQAEFMPEAEPTGGHRKAGSEPVSCQDNSSYALDGKRLAGGWSAPLPAESAISPDRGLRCLGMADSSPRPRLDWTKASLRHSAQSSRVNGSSGNSRSISRSWKSRRDRSGSRSGSLRMNSTLR
jgi:integrase